MEVDFQICAHQGADMVERRLTKSLLKAAKTFKVVTITGPRQSGKTTLARMAFPEYKYYDMDNLMLIQRYEADPLSFLEPQDGRFIIDEFQTIPSVCNYIKVISDEQNSPGQYILTGSNQFEYMKGVSQSLAGRTALLKLLPLSWDEMFKDSKSEIFTAIQRGWYPALLNEDLDSNLFYSSYLGTYLERDIRNLAMISDLGLFRRFLSLCAGWTGSELNKSKLSEASGISIKTLNNWLSLLETSYIITFLQPYHRNWKKRLVKTPKMYFLDTGLLCFLLGIQNAQTLQNHPLRGEIFETYVLGEVVKYLNNNMIPANLMFLKENRGIEIDLIIEYNAKLIPIEIKSGLTFNSSWLENLKKITEKEDFSKGLIIYANTEEFEIKNIRICSGTGVSRALSQMMS
jgi:predicted AAA+ superfamily ATPase